MKKFILIAVSLALIGFAASFYITQHLSKPEPVIEFPIVEQPQPAKDTTLYFVGDMMLDRGVESSVNKNFSGDFNQLFNNVNELKNADILFANLEGPISDKGNNVGSQYSFRMDPKVTAIIAGAGFDIVSFANNHVGDWNTAAFSDTLNNLRVNGILFTGAGDNKTQAETPAIIERNGVRFGFLAFSDVGPNWIEAKETSPGVLIANDPRLPEIIQNAKTKCDVLIVSFHWGEEYKSVHNNQQEALAHRAVDNGADLVIGHHPHVIEDIETYKEKPIVYSLGNFIFDQPFSKDTMHGMLFEATFTGKELKNTQKRYIQLNKNYQPEGIIEKLPEEPKPVANTCPQPQKEYADASYVGVDQNVPLPDKLYIPKDLVRLDKSISKSSLCAKKEAVDALKRMSDAAKKENLSILASSAFRDYATQKAILESNIKSGNPNATIAVAKPGYSEHQLGVAFDLTSASIAYASANKKFGDTKEAAWLEDHAYEYGFIESYPLGKEDITGYMYEPWHYRYVGIENAKEIKRRGITINKYFQEINS